MQEDVSLVNELSNTDTKGIPSLSESDSPCYRLRAFTSGKLDQRNWIQTPVLSSDAKEDLSVEQCEETFKLFLLSGLRLSQMTRTYHDIDAVMQLLKEKERDLELAAHIGQTLLYKNKEVAQQNEILEEKLAHTLEEASQLRHEVTRKEQLLHFYTDVDPDVSGNNSPVKELKESFQTRVDCLRSKIQQLENDNRDLLEEKFQLSSSSEEYKEEQHEMVSSTVRQLNALQEDLHTANTQILAVTDELTKHSSESSYQRNEMSILLDQIVELQKKHSQLMSEHEELQIHLSVANKSQYQLSQEVQDLECKYHEVLSMLDETREEMRAFRDLSLNSASSSFDRNVSPYWPVPFRNSLAAELEVSSISCENQSIAHSVSIPGHLVKPLGESTSMSSCESSITCMEENIPIQQHFVGRKLLFSSSFCSTPSLPSQQPAVQRRTTKWTIGSPTSSGLMSPGMGQPGIPGTADLERAIEKLSRVGKESLKFVEQTKQLLKTERTKNMKKCFSTPKLRIVKPLEGSLTLHNWKTLADNSDSFSALVKSPVQSPGILMRSNLSSDISISNDESSSKSERDMFENVSKQSADIAFTKELPSISAISGSEFTPSVRRGQKTSLKSVKSSPHLLSLAAVLEPVNKSEESSVVHAAAKSLFHQPTTKTSKFDLAQLHGSNNNHRC